MWIEWSWFHSLEVPHSCIWSKEPTKWDWYRPGAYPPSQLSLGRFSLGVQWLVAVGERWVSACFHQCFTGPGSLRESTPKPAGRAISWSSQFWGRSHGEGRRFSDSASSLKWETLQISKVDLSSKIKSQRFWSPDVRFFHQQACDYCKTFEIVDRCNQFLHQNVVVITNFPSWRKTKIDYHNGGSYTRDGVSKKKSWYTHLPRLQFDILLSFKMICHISKSDSPEFARTISCSSFWM